MRAIRAFLRRHALVRLFIVHTLIGYGLATLFVGALIGFDLGGIATLIANQDAEPFILLLWFFVGLTFASAQMGMAIMSLTDEQPPRGGKRARVRRGAFARARAPHLK
jgi:hypothetical protein